MDPMEPQAGIGCTGCCWSCSSPEIHTFMGYGSRQTTVLGSSGSPRQGPQEVAFGFWVTGQVKAVGKSRNGACGEEQGMFPRFGAPMGNTGVFCALISPSWGMPEPRIVQKKGFFPGERPREISAYSWEGAGRGTC